MSSAGDCRHFRGPFRHKTCRAGQVFTEVMRPGPPMKRLPCLNLPDRVDTCAAYEPLTELEAWARDAKVAEQVSDILSGLCGECGRLTEERDDGDVVIRVCLEHGEVMRGCRRAGGPTP